MSRKYKYDYDLVKKMIDGGKSFSEVAKHYECSTHAIAHYCSRNGIKAYRENLVGHKHNYFEVIEKIPIDDMGRQWRCKCICGNTRDFNTYDITKRKNNISCGCYRHTEECIKSNGRWEGYEEISGQFINSIKKGARTRCYEYNITPEYIWELYIKQDRKCALTGMDIKFAKILSGPNKEETTASLDRIINTKGYIQGNVQWLHKDVNILKMDYDQDDFIEICRQITNYQNSKKTE